MPAYFKLYVDNASKKFNFIPHQVDSFPLLHSKAGDWYLDYIEGYVPMEKMLFSTLLLTLLLLAPLLIRLSRPLTTEVEKEKKKKG